MLSVGVRHTVASHDETVQARVVKHRLGIPYPVCSVARASLCSIPEPRAVHLSELVSSFTSCESSYDRSTQPQGQ